MKNRVVRGEGEMMNEQWTKTEN